MASKVLVHMFLIVEARLCFPWQNAYLCMQGAKKNVQPPSDAKSKSDDGKEY